MTLLTDDAYADIVANTAAKGKKGAIYGTHYFSKKRILLNHGLVTWKQATGPEWRELRAQMREEIAARESATE